MKQCADLSILHRKGESLVEGVFDPETADVIANALERDGMTKEADEWRRVASWCRDDE